MHIHCPNCKASFTVESGKLPTPKYNGSLQTYGWKFECGQCDTQWWVCLTPTSSEHVSSPMSLKKDARPSPLLQDLITFGASNTYSGMNELLTVPSPKRTSQPITFPSEEVSYEVPRLQNFNENRSTRLRYEPLYSTKKSFLFLKLLGFLVLLFALLLTFEFFYPRKINTAVKNAYSSVSKMIKQSNTKQNNNAVLNSSDKRPVLSMEREQNGRILPSSPVRTSQPVTHLPN